jgi:hypothetical protein
VAAEGWGAFSQRSLGHTMEASLHVKSGIVRVRTLGLRAPFSPGAGIVRVGRDTLPATLKIDDGEGVTVILDHDLRLIAGNRLEVSLRAFV